MFGDYIDVYDLTRAVEDKATVRVFYESRLIAVDLPEGVEPELIDERADEATTGLDDSEREHITQAVTIMNAVYGAPDRLRMLARDIVDHWEARSARDAEVHRHSRQGHDRVRDTRHLRGAIRANYPHKARLAQ